MSLTANQSIEQDLVSIVVPVYNAAKFLDDTIKTVKNQTYGNWELILVNDCSKDKSVNLIKRYQKDDKRIKLFSMEINSGAALSRNKGIDEAHGKYLAFLDADDLWKDKKLEKQIAFMKSKDCAFSFTGYEFANSDGKPNGKKVFIPNSINYKQALKNTIIWTSTVIFDIEKLSKQNIHMPNVKSEDTATWWNILRQGYIAYGLNEILSYYRRSEGSLSSNKLIAIKRTWDLYRVVERLNIFYSCYCFCWYAFNATMKRL